MLQQPATPIHMSKIHSHTPPEKLFGKDGTIDDEEIGNVQSVIYGLEQTDFDYGGCLENDARFKSGQKLLKSNTIASLV